LGISLQIYHSNNATYTKSIELHPTLQYATELFDPAHSPPAHPVSTWLTDLLRLYDSLMPFRSDSFLTRLPELVAVVVVGSGQHTPARGPK